MFSYYLIFSLKIQISNPKHFVVVAAAVAVSAIHPPCGTGVDNEIEERTTRNFKNTRRPATPRQRDVSLILFYSIIIIIGRLACWRGF